MASASSTASGTICTDWSLRRQSRHLTSHTSSLDVPNLRQLPEGTLTASPPPAAIHDDAARNTNDDGGDKCCNEGHESPTGRRHDQSEHRRKRTYQCESDGTTGVRHVRRAEEQDRAGNHKSANDTGGRRERRRGHVREAVAALQLVD